jgi:hypothetical protein
VAALKVLSRAPMSEYMRRALTIALAATVAALTLITTNQPMATATATWPVVPATSPDYAQKVDFVTACTVTKAGYFDPIVAPGVGAFGHRHTFSGGTSISPRSTAASLLAGGTTCKDSLDKSAYWMPSLYKVTGAVARLVEPYEVRAYYRAATTRGAGLAVIPFGLRMIAGDSRATSVQSGRIGGFQCRTLADGNVIPRQAIAPSCPRGTFMEASIVFPNCWDGKHLDSANHKSHLAYAVPSQGCDPAHPVRLPALTVAERFPVNAFLGGQAKVAALPGMLPTQLTLHADFINAWSPRELAYLTRNCLHASVACATVTNSRRPPVA